MDDARLINSGDTSYARLRVVLVHGTFATKEGWPTTSILRKHLEASFPHCQITALGWTGKNNNKDRIESGERLHDLIATLAVESPDSPVVIIAHSHGGHAAMYALRDRTLHSVVAGVATMGTPFIYAQNRMVRPFLRSFLKSLQFRITVAFSFLLLLLVPRPTLVRVVMPLSAAAMVLVLLLVILEMAVLRWTRYSIERNGKKLLRRTLLAWIHRSQKDSTKALAHPRDCDVPFFCVQQKNDEAFLLLFLQNLVANIPIVLLTLFTFVTRFWARIYTTVGTLLCLGLVFESWSYHPMLARILFAGFFLFSVLLLICMIGEVATLIIVLMSQNHMCGFGSQKIGFYLWNDVHVDRVPTGCSRVEFSTFRLPLSLRGLRHCRYYDHPKVVADITQRIRTWVHRPS
jgi:pimeloyl-ACP methyl ester carboxylesterase